MEDDQELSSVNILSFVDEQEWDIRDIIEIFPEVWNMHRIDETSAKVI